VPNPTQSICGLVCITVAGLAQTPAIPSLPDNWSKPWIPITLPAEAPTATSSYPASDGHIYITDRTGIFRARQEKLIAEPGNPDNWTKVTQGFPKGPDGAPAIRVGAWGETASGQVLAGFGVNLARGCGCGVAKWDGTQWTHVVQAPTFPPNSAAITSILLDSANRIYATTLGGNVFRSNNDGKSWSKVLAGGYTAFQHRQGYVFNSRIFGDQYYFAGEGDLGITTDLTFRSATFELQGSACTPGSYCHNRRDLQSDGDPAHAPVSEIVASADDGDGISGLQRKDIPTGKWSAVAGAYQYWTWRRVEKGGSPHEYYVGGGNGRSSFAVLGSVDGGRTWSVVGSLMPCANAEACKAVVRISPVDHSKWLHSGNLLWYHP
jgi:photosystem II stability/assembly factor-like uncharacterized protein